MKTQFLKTVLCAAALQATVAAAAQSQVNPSAGAQQIMRAGSQASVAGSANYFIGHVRIDPVWPANNDINASGGLVTFAPGARSAWHTHPKGQYLMVTSGVGLVQE
jgi:quercetin dioxygenase-like cupin family protein